MRILFCGIMVPEEIEYQVKNISAAGNRFQNNVIKNLKLLGHEVLTVSYVAIPIPEKFRKALVDTEDGKYIIRESFGGLETYQAVRKCRKTVGNLIKTIDCVICYNIFYSYYFIPRAAKKYLKNSLLILADFSGPESFKSIGRKVYACLQGRMLQKYDVVIGLSANTEKRLKKGQKFILMEGGIDQEFYDSFIDQEKENGEPTIFMYSGLLSRVTGVDLLLEAMKENRDQDIRLVITGKGDLEQSVKDAAQKDDRIEYKGHLTYEEYISELQRADVLVNPRNMELPENQNNFPSKILEYLATGKRIVSTKFVGWERFEENVVFCESTAKGLNECLDIIHGLADEKNVFLANRKKAGEFEWKVQLRSILEQILKNEWKE